MQRLWGKPEAPNFIKKKKPGEVRAYIQKSSFIWQQVFYGSCCCLSLFLWSAAAGEATVLSSLPGIYLPPNTVKLLFTKGV